MSSTTIEAVNPVGQSQPCLVDSSGHLIISGTTGGGTDPVPDFAPTGTHTSLSSVGLFGQNDSPTADNWRALQVNSDGELKVQTSNAGTGDNVLIKGENPADAIVSIQTETDGRLITNSTANALTNIADPTTKVPLLTDAQGHLQVDIVGGGGAVFDGIIKGNDGVDGGGTTRTINTDAEGLLNVNIQMASNCNSSATNDPADSLAVGLKGRTTITDASTDTFLKCDGSGILSVKEVGTVFNTPSNDTNSHITDDPANSVACGLKARTTIATATTETFLLCDATGKLEVSNADVETSLGTINSSIGTSNTSLTAISSTNTNMDTNIANIDTVQTAMSVKLDNGTQKSQIVDGSGSVIASSGNALNVNVVSGGGSSGGGLSHRGQVSNANNYSNLTTSATDNDLNTNVIYGPNMRGASASTLNPAVVSAAGHLNSEINGVYVNNASAVGVSTGTANPVSISRFGAVNNRIMYMPQTDKTNTLTTFNWGGVNSAISILDTSATPTNAIIDMGDDNEFQHITINIFFDTNDSGNWGTSTSLQVADYEFSLFGSKTLSSYTPGSATNDIDNFQLLDTSGYVSNAHNSVGQILLNNTSTFHWKLFYNYIGVLPYRYILPTLTMRNSKTSPSDSPNLSVRVSYG